MTYILAQGCEIAFYGKKTACLEFSKHHPSVRFTLYVVTGEVEVIKGRYI